MDISEHSPTPWFVNGHSIESKDDGLWVQNEKTGRGVIANLPSCPKSRMSKANRDTWDEVVEANAHLIVEAVNKFVEDANKPKRNCDRPFKTLAEFQRYYIEHGCKNGFGMVVDGEITKVPWKSNFEKWMLEPWKE